MADDSVDSPRVYKAPNMVFGHIVEVKVIC